MHFLLNTTTSAPAKRRVLFYRDFRGFTGGHLKIWDYFNHVASFAGFEPRIAFSAESKWDATNPWSHSQESVVPWAPAESDLLFLAGTASASGFAAIAPFRGHPQPDSASATRR